LWKVLTIWWNIGKLVLNEIEVSLSDDAFGYRHFLYALDLRYLSNIAPKQASFPDFVYAPISNCSRNSALRASNMAPQLQLT
jgi:hypothetical protein